jgi:hypothetical protein
MDTCHFHSTAPLPMRKIPQIITEQEIGWAPQSVWILPGGGRKISCTFQELSFDSSVVRPVTIIHTARTNIWADKIKTELIKI